MKENELLKVKIDIEEEKMKKNEKKKSHKKVFLVLQQATEVQRFSTRGHCKPNNVWEIKHALRKRPRLLMQLQNTILNFSDFCKTTKLNGKFLRDYILTVLRKFSVLFFLLFLGLSFLFSSTGNNSCLYKAQTCV